MARRLPRWFRIGFLVVGGILLTAGLWLLAILQVWPTDRHEFLAGRQAKWAGIHPPYEADSFTGPGWSVPPEEYRIYSWKEDYWAARDRIGKELVPLGFKPVAIKDPKDASGWYSPDSRCVWLNPGSSPTRHDLYSATGVSDPAGVTVTCSNDAPDNWITHNRIAFEPRY